MSAPEHDPSQRGRALVALYDAALPEVYGYLVSRCRSDTVAENLTSATFLTAVDAVRRDAVRDPSVAWLIGVARHEMIDHWRQSEGESSPVHPVVDDPAGEPDPLAWDVSLDVTVAHETLAGLRALDRSALVLRYFDGLPVREVAEHLGRTVEATEALLVRARAAFRAHYEPSNIDRWKDGR